MNLMEKYRDKGRTGQDKKEPQPSLTETGQTTSCDRLDGQKAAEPGSGSRKARTAPDKGREQRYTFIYDHGILNDHFLFTKTDEEAQALRDSGILDPVYSHREVKELEGLTPESIKAHHLIKKTFQGSIIEKG